MVMQWSNGVTADIMLIEDIIEHSVDSTRCVKYMMSLSYSLAKVGPVVQKNDIHSTYSKLD